MRTRKDEEPSGTVSKMRLLVLALALLLATPAAADDTADDDTFGLPDGPFGLTGPLDDRFVALFEAEAPLTEWFPVVDQVVPVGRLRVQLVDGAASPIKTTTGIVAGFVYRGPCHVSYRPPDGIEHESFQRGTGLDAWDETPCDSVFVHTDDDALLDRVGLEGETVAAPTVTEEHQILLDDFILRSSVPLSSLARTLGATRSQTPTYDVLIAGGEFGAPVAIDDDEPRKPYNIISTAHVPWGLMAEHEGFLLFAARRFGFGKHGQLLNSHPLDAAPGAVPPPSVRVTATDLTMDLDIVPADSFTRLQATAELTVQPEDRTTQALLFSLDGGTQKDAPEPGARTPLLVSAVTDGAGRSLPFLHRQGRLLVWLAEPVASGTQSKVSVTYAGSGVKKESLYHFGLFANWNWYPSGPGRPHMDWRATVCLPDGPSIAGTGVTVSSEVADGRRCEVHEAKTPVNFPAMNMGWWETAEKQRDGQLLRAWFSREQTAQIQPALDLADHILGVYADLFGPLPHKEIDIAQGRNFRFFWQAPDGLVEMSASFDGSNRSTVKQSPGDFIEDLDSYILAHELAHQYWGHVVGWTGYRDQWISESFADYSAYMYMLRTNGEAAGHHQYWRQRSVFSGRRGAITLGRRNGRMYTALVYSRGPLVLHMFRKMVGDEAFLAWMRTLVDLGRQRQAVSTEDVILVAEHLVGPDARWFFEQWLHHPGVPDLAASWRQTGNTVAVTLTQSNTPEPLRLIVPVLLRSKKGPAHDVVYQVATDRAELTVELAAPKGGVKSVALDPYEEMVRDEAKVTKAE